MRSEMKFFLQKRLNNNQPYNTMARAGALYVERNYHTGVGGES